MSDSMIKILLVYLVVINIATFLFSRADKRAAVKDLRRVPESRLILLSLLGGSLGMLLSMKAFRHKTRKPKFSIGVPVILILQTAAALYFISRL